MRVNRKKHISGLLSALPAVLLSVWYLLAVSGIDIHRDAEHGKVFVVPGFVGCYCEFIHPDQHCLDTSADPECFDDEDCCSNDFTAVLALGEDPDSDSVILPAPVSFPFSALRLADSASAGSAAGVSGRGNAPPPSELSVSISKLSVLRI